MIKVICGNNIKRETVIVEKSESLRNVLENVGIDYTRGLTTLDGAPMQPGDLDKTFDDFGIADRCYLLSVVKADNA